MKDASVIMARAHAIVLRWYYQLFQRQNGIEFPFSRRVKGAVIFGRSRRFPWSFPTLGPPVEVSEADGLSEHDIGGAWNM
jgi:hypothetical protein